MSGLYDRVQRSPRQKTFPWWAVILAIALVVLTCIGLFLSRPQRIKNRYEACMDAVSASTIYAKRHRGVRALVDGQELRLRESNARSMYSTLATLGVGHFTDRLPEGEPDATLYYSDTSVMRLWRYPLAHSSSGRWEGVFISFVSLDGTTYSYYTDRTDWQRLSWPLKAESNDPWEE